MALLQTRVVPLSDWREAALFGAAAGMVMILAAWILVWAVERWVPLNTGSWQPLVLVQVVFVVVFNTPLFLLLRRTQRLKSVSAFLFAFALIVPTGFAASKIMLTVHGGVLWREWLKPDIFVGILVVIVGYMLWGLIALAVCRWVIRRVEEHAKGDCIRCGYTIGSDHLVVCPECGADQVRARASVAGTTQFLRAMRTHWRAIGGVMLACVVLFAGFAYVTRMRPVLRLLGAVPHRHAALNYAPTPQYVDSELKSAEGIVVWTAESREKNRSLAVWMSPRGGGKFPMVVWVSTRVVVWSSTWNVSYEANTGSAVIITGLSATQAEHALKYGIPNALQEALFAKVDEVHWTSHSDQRNQRVHRIDASAFFRE